MTIVSDPAAPAPVRPPRSSDVLVPLLLIAAELVVGWYTYDLAQALSHHLTSSRLVRWFFLMLPFLPLAAVVALHALTRRRAAVAALVALGAGGVMIGYAELVDWLFTDAPVEPSGRLVDTLGYAVSMAVAVLATLAWGISRRHGRRWPIGLLVAAAGAALTVWTRWPEHVAWGHSTFTTVEGHNDPIRHFYLVSTVARMLPVVAACIVCWLVDRAELRRTPPAS
jgi:hypothetical protein